MSARREVFDLSHSVQASATYPRFSRYKNYLREIRKLVRDAWFASLLFSVSALYFHDRISLTTLNFSIALSLGYVLAYSVNDYHDRFVDVNDSYKARRNFFVEKDIKKTTFLFVISVLGVYFFFSAILFGLKGVIVLFLASFIAWAYSSPPLRFKTRPGLDLIVHSLFVLTFPYASTVFVLEEPLLVQDIAMLLLTTLGSAIIQLENQLRDYEIDKLSEKNFTIAFGKNVSATLIVILNVLVGVVFVYCLYKRIFPLFFAPFGLAYSPLFIYRIVRPGKVRSENAIRMILILEGIVFVAFLIFWMIASFWK